ncbi:MAG TPA: hypothetical protein VK092_03115 [Deinococcales bacterium]|nr:hypothetical protein [Deinococcales bacterium]
MHMELDEQTIRALIGARELPVPPEDLPEIARRLNALLAEAATWTEHGASEAEVWQWQFAEARDE